MLIRHARSATAPIYLFACLILGGSAQGIWQNAVLQLSGLGLIAWAAASSCNQPLPQFAKQLFLIVLVGLTYILIQLFPLPLSIWSQVGPRESIAEGFELLGVRGQFAPLSLAPYKELGSLLGLIPAIAMFSCVVRLRAYRVEWLAIALALATVFGILLGSLQVTNAVHGSSWYLYSQTNYGSAVGFFSNANHMALLIVLNIPFLSVFITKANTGNDDRYSARLLTVSGLLLLFVVGIALNGSLAGYILALPVLAASALVVFRASKKATLWALCVAICLFISGVIVLELTPIGSHVLTDQASVSVATRRDIFLTTWKAICDFFPFGSGLGSFELVYHLYENPSFVTTSYVNHAHNDYLELILELGSFGMIIIAVFISSWVTAVWEILKPAKGNAFARAAAVASAAILIHSAVDFPLRTAAISAAFAMCLALIAESASPSPLRTNSSKSLRHIVIG